MSNTSGTVTNQGRAFTIVGAVLGVISIFFIPLLFGIVGAILGFVGYSRGDKPLGLYVGIGALVAMVVGIVLGVVVFNASR